MLFGFLISDILGGDVAEESGEGKAAPALHSYFYTPQTPTESWLEFLSSMALPVLPLPLSCPSSLATYDMTRLSVGLSPVG